MSGKKVNINSEVWWARKDSGVAPETMDYLFVVASRDKRVVETTRVKLFELLGITNLDMGQDVGGGFEAGWHYAVLDCASPNRVDKGRLREKFPYQRLLSDWRLSTPRSTDALKDYVEEQLRRKRD